MKRVWCLVVGLGLLSACHNNDAAELCASNRVAAETPIYFKLGSDIVRPEFEQQLDAGLIFIQGHRFKKVYLDGYADETGPKSYNVELSQKRAESVRDYLVAHGVDESRIVTNGHGVESGKPYEKHRMVKISFK